jgi:hypothetical protein
MQSFHEWKLGEMANYNPQLDGQPLKPTTISGAQNQIFELARNIRTTFMLDERFKPYAQYLRECEESLDHAAHVLSNVSVDEPHKFGM